ncbi:hypothetical protein [Rhodosalinus sp.]|uniref:hypothetical protein n=1 Tax=Rhodosalinus sp. TaxID=2047741 RepID=UPI00356B0795
MSKAGSKPGQTDTAQPGEERSFEIWKLYKRPGSFTLYWRRTYPKPKHGAPFPERPYDKGRNFDLVGGGKIPERKDNPDKGSRITKRRGREGDLIVNDTSGKVDAAHYISKELLGKSGEVYLRTRAENGDKMWMPLLARGRTRKPGEPEQHGPGVAKKRDHAYAWLDDILGSEGALIAARPLIDQETWDEFKSTNQDLSDFATSYSFTLIRGPVSSDIYPTSHQWVMVQNKGGSEKTTDYKAKDLEYLVKRDYTKFDRALTDYDLDIEELVEKLKKQAAKIHAGDKSKERGQKAIGLAHAILDEAVPSATPGTTAPLGYIGTLTSEGVIPEDKIAELTRGLTQSGIENAGTLVAVIVDIHTIATMDVEADRGELNQTAGNLVDNLAKLGHGVSSLAETLYTVVQGADNVPSALLQLNDVVGPAIGYANALRTGRKATHSGRRYVRLVGLRAVLNEEARDAGDDAATEGYEELDRLLGYILGKMGRRTAKQWTTTAAGVVGATGSTIGIVLAATAVANIWNPVGWTLLAGGAVLGLGVVAWTSWRHFTKKKRREKRYEKGKPKSIGEFTDRVIAILSLRGVEDSDKAALDRSTTDYFSTTEKLRREIREAWEKDDAVKAHDKLDALEKERKKLDYRIVQRELARDILDIFNVPLGTPQGSGRYRLFDKRNNKWGFTAGARRRTRRIVKRHAKR